MGLKMNGFGLMYNDTNTSSMGKDFEINIQTSNAGGKYHIIDCKFCGTKNKIALEIIKQRLEQEMKVQKAKLGDRIISEEDKYIDHIKGSMCSFRCGKCNMPISTTISHKDIDIYSTNEYHNEVKKIVDNIENKVKNGQASLVSKERYEADRKRD